MTKIWCVSIKKWGAKIIFLIRNGNQTKPCNLVESAAVDITIYRVYGCEHKGKTSVSQKTSFKNISNY